MTDPLEIIMRIEGFIRVIQAQGLEQYEYAQNEAKSVKNKSRQAHYLKECAKGVGKVEAANSMVRELQSLVDEMKGDYNGGEDE